MQQPTRTDETGGAAEVAVRNGLATLGPDAVGLRAALDGTFAGWGTARGALPMLYAPLLAVADLDRIDYLNNFPHLGTAATGLLPEAAKRYSAKSEPTSAIPADDLQDAGYLLPSAACYSVYLNLAGSVIDEVHTVTTVANCFRREDHFDGLRRLLGFSMREVVVVGERDAVLNRLAELKKRVTEFLAEIELPITVAAASDPFFDSSGGRSLMAQLFPVKEEFVFGEGLAIGSVNFHRNFFGERCDIRTVGGEPAFSGCVAFGLERWISALTTHFGVGPAEVSARLADVLGTRP
ncbi:hypothetical protein F0L68_39075 [Solihabitans fulvus]|uniref:Aminoacyl-transfer RNA synthetases class-II family profile domain-containing protein n=1 Tax=Solihabitans fulvus TaxID=1892852 RepID=A0A5B2WH07_9PSEU|nr:hypothetical protein [Solihabitans fulvus]KAA2250148.1 hypothetical protein F0L68_39075 [Solihabitans fulvus]